MSELFQPFPKIPRLNRDCVITEKIDGTNASVVIRSKTDPGFDEEFGDALDAVATVGDALVWAGARNGYRQPGKGDNFGFAAWVLDNAEALVATLGPGRHFGEWWGPGIQRGYALDMKRFSLFHPRWRAVLDGRRKGALRVPEALDVVPVLFEGLFRTSIINAVLDDLRATGSKAAPGFKFPEGIVVFHTAASQYFKVTLEGDEKPKGQA